MADEPDPFVTTCTACESERVHANGTGYLVCPVCDRPTPPKP